MTVKIIIPEGGKPQYIMAIAVRGDIIGSITFTNQKDLEHFNQAFESLIPLGFGSIRLDIDTYEDGNE